jgi:FkbM family methyltransferase
VALRRGAGLRVWAHPGGEMDRLLFLTGCLEPNETHWLRQTLRPGMVMLDIGANFGHFTLTAARCVGPTGHVVAFEPSDRECDRLSANLELNGLDNVTIVRAAAGAASGRASLHIADAPNTGHNTLGRFVYDATREAMVQPVSVVTVDQTVAELGLSRVDVIKLDVEGAELHALRGASATILRDQPTLMIEVNDATLGHQGTNARQLWDFLHNHGYYGSEFDPATGRLVDVPPRARYDDSVNVVARSKAAARSPAAAA